MSNAAEQQREVLAELLRTVTLNKSLFDGQLPRMAFMSMVAQADSYLEVLESVASYYAGTWQLSGGDPT